MALRPKGDLAFTSATIIGEVGFGLTVIVLDVVNTDLSAVRDTVSELVLGPFGTALTGALVLHGVGIVALVPPLRHGLPDATRIKLGLAALAVAGVSVLGVALFPTDAAGATPTGTGALHRAAATVSFIGLPIGFLALATPFARRFRAAGWLRPTAWASAAATALLGLGIAMPERFPVGLVERLPIG